MLNKSISAFLFTVILLVGCTPDDKGKLDEEIASLKEKITGLTEENQQLTEKNIELIDLIREKNVQLEELQQSKTHSENKQGDFVQYPHIFYSDHFGLMIDPPLLNEMKPLLLIYAEFLKVFAYHIDRNSRESLVIKNNDLLKLINEKQEGIYTGRYSWVGFKYEKAVTVPVPTYHGSETEVDEFAILVDHEQQKSYGYFKTDNQWVRYSISDEYDPNQLINLAIFFSEEFGNAQMP